MLHRPSSWPIRKERRHIAANNAHLQVMNKLDEMSMRISKLEFASGPPGLTESELTQGILPNLARQIEEIHKVVVKMSLPLNLRSSDTHQRSPTVDYHDHQDRLDRLEKILVCTPPKVLEPSVDQVLDQLLLHRIDEQQSSVEPELELTPEKSKRQSLGPNFDAFHENVDEGNVKRQLTASLSGSVHTNSNLSASIECASPLNMDSETHVEDLQSLLKKCTGIAQQVCSEVRQMQEKGEQHELEKLIIDKFGSILSSCPTSPRTKLDREEIRRRYDRHDRHWVWSLVCRTFHNSTGDPESKSDAFIEIMHILWCLLSKNEIS